MRKTKASARIFAFSLLALFWLFLWSPSAVARMAEKPPVKEPFEKVVFKQGPWGTEYTDVEGQARLIVGYQGSMENEGGAASQTAARFRLTAKTVLKGMYFPTAYPVQAGALPPAIEVTLKDSKGNTYGPFEALTYKQPTAQPGEGDIQLRMAPGESSEGMGQYIYADNIFISPPEELIVLPAGMYELAVSHPEALVRNRSTGGKPALLIKGVDYSAWQEYEKKLAEWERKQEAGGEEGKGAPKAGEAITQGDAALVDAVMEPEKSTAPPKVSGGETIPASQRKPALLELDKDSEVEMIVLNTFNRGQGAPPGKIQITDQQNKVVAELHATGTTLGGVANGAWVVRSNMTLPAGTYTLRVANPEVLAYDAEGNPDVAVVTRPAKPKLYYFTGTYRINVDVVKTSTLMGPVTGGGKSFELRDFNLTVLDRGESIELVGKYQDMPFSQLCKVTKREPQRVEATLQAGMDLKNLPYKAKIGASVLIVLEKPPGLQPRITASGTGTYQRVSKKMGSDFNTYRITASGSLATTDLPFFVMAAIGKQTGSVGNIPGPDSPFTAATGMLFPPLAALVANLIQEAIRSKLSKEQLLEIELAKRGIKKYSLEWYQAMYPGASKETLAWIMMADALSNSDEPDDDPFSVSDEEKTTQGYTAGETGSEEEVGYGEETGEAEPEEPSAEEGLGLDAEGAMKEVALTTEVFQDELKQLEAERDQWAKYLEESLKSADPNDPRAKELHQQYQDYINHLNDRINEAKAAKEYEALPKRTVVVDHTGRTAEIAFDPKSGQWYNSETGNPFDVERYERDVLPNLEKDVAFIAEQRHKLETRDTEFDRMMDRLVEDQKRRSALLGQLQKWRNEAYGIEPPAEGVGDVKAHIERLINDLSRSDVPLQDLQDRASRIGKVIIDRRTGRALGEAEGKALAEREGSAASILAHTVWESGVDVITGRTWAGMGGRAGLAALTGGASEYVMSPAEAMFDIKESIEAGESGTRATLKAMGKYVLGELAGEYAGKAWEKSGYQLNQELVEKLTKWGNTPVSELIGMGGKAGSKEGMEKVISAKSKLLLEGAGGGKPYKIADDVADYAKYKAGVNNQASIIEGKIRAGEEVSLEDIRKVLRDPSVARELKNSHIDIQNTYQDALEKNIYNPAKNNTASRLEQEMLEKVQKEFGPGAKAKIEVESIRTPGSRGSRINADHDVTGKITVTDASGKTITRELPAEQVAKVYNEEFAKASGILKDGKIDLSRAKAEIPEGVTVIGKDGRPRQISWEEASYDQQLEAWAKRHGQEVTDSRVAEAAVDFSPDKSPTGVSNVAQLKAGVSTAGLADPEGLAKMEQYKINSWFNKGGIANQTEAYEQLAKMGKLTKDLTNAYQKLGYNAADLPSNMQKALDLVSNRNLSPGARNLELQKLGFDGPQDLANKLSARIEGLQKLGRASSGKPEGRVLNKVIAAVAKSHLNEQQ